MMLKCTARLLATAMVAISAAFIMTVPASAQAQTAAPRSYVVMSLIGDKMTVVTRQPELGSRLDKNSRAEYGVPNDTLDGVAVRAAHAAIKRATPDARVELFTSTDPKLFARQDSAIGTDAANGPLIEMLRETLVQTKATHLLLITKNRADASLKLADGHVGSGKLVGVGFYVDPTLGIENTRTGESSKGFLATYAYLTFTLLDAQTLQRLGELRVTESSTYGTYASKTASIPWESLTPAQKLESLTAAIQTAVDDNLPKLLAAR